MKKSLTMFMWGYWGWGNHTRQLVRAVDAVEEARGFRPPVFVDIRIRRGVRAKGFVGDAFHQLVGDRRYKWMQGLGNKAIKTGGRRIIIERPPVAKVLLDEAVKLDKEKRRLIFFCSCEFPCECHRTTVMGLLLHYAGKRNLPVQVMEWPGGNPRMIDVPVADRHFKQLSKDRKSIPLVNSKPLAAFAGLPWGSIARVHTANGNESLSILTGPAKCWSSDDWYLPVMDKLCSAKCSHVTLKRRIAKLRCRLGVEGSKLVDNRVSNASRTQNMRITVIEFSRKHRANDDRKFQEWCDQNPNGFYLNRKPSGQFMLHKSGCHHAGALSPGSSPTTNPKYSSPGRAELESWAFDCSGVRAELCSGCL